MSVRLVSYILLISLLSNSVKSQDFKELDSIADHIVKDYGIRGIAMVGVKNGEVIYSRGVGYANEHHKMDSSTPLYIASNTKAFIGLAMAQLIAKGKISPDDRLIDYIDRKYFPEALAVEQITLKDVISHSHGLSNDPITFRTSSSGEYPNDIRELLKFTEYYPKGDTLVKKHRYSNLGYLLLGMVVENITGQSWKEYLLQHVLSPLEMKGSSPYLPKGALADKMAIPYHFRSKTPLKLVKKDNTMHAAGGMITTLDDMGTWLNFMTAEDNKTNVFGLDIHPYFKTLADTDDSLGPLKIHGYGYGWYFGSFFDLPFNFHTGGFSGHASLMSYMPDLETGFFIFINEQSRMFRSALQLVLVYYSIIMDHPGKAKVNEMFSAMSRDIYQNYKPENLVKVDAQLQTIPTGTFVSEKYGTLKIIKIDLEYYLYLGANLHSIAYRGPLTNTWKAEFVPGSIENFSLQSEGETDKIRFGDDFGYFTRTNR
ncbi:MAG: class A beta-lactamase-related serine hydrolase [Flavobacterium sp.]|nr:MAG: class A beta-lactamase-related serine hydrolase [Flavobacterium sp.]